VASEAGEGGAVSTAVGGDDGRRSKTGSGSGGRRASTGGAASSPRLRRFAATLIVALAVMLLAGSAQAFGAGQREHVFSFSFGSLGTGTGQFFHPTGIGVSSLSGDVYVADRENNRIEAFQPVLRDGELVGETPVESGAMQAKVPVPEEIAVDNCTSGSTACTNTEDPSLGDVYVVGGSKSQSKKPVTGEPEDLYLYKFTSQLKPVGSPRKFKEPIDGVAVSPSGELFVYQSDGRIAQLNDNEENETISGPPVQAGFVGEGEHPGFAVDSNGNFYAVTVADEDEARASAGLERLVSELAEANVDVVAKLQAGTGDVLVHELDYENSAAVAVNPANHDSENGVDEENDVYVAGVESVDGEPATTVSAFSPAEGEGNEAEGEGKLIQRFSAPGLKESEGLAVSPGTGTVYVTDAASNRVDVFELEPPGPPTTSALSSSLENGVRTLSAQVSAAGAEAHAFFEYGTASCAADPSACTSTVPVDIGAGYGGQTVAANLPHLAPGEYHYRVVAESSQGQLRSSEQTFAVVATLGALPDGRAWEMVSPPDKNGAEPEAITKERGAIQAAANGDAITYVADGPIPASQHPEGNRSPEPNQILSTRNLAPEPGHEAWESQDIVTPNDTGSGTNPGIAPEYQFFSSNLALALVEPFRSASGPYEDPPLSPALEVEGKAIETEGEQEHTPYLRADTPLQPRASEEADYNVARENGVAMTPENAGFLPLVTKLNEPGPEFGLEFSPSETSEEGVYLQGTTADLSHVVLTSERPNAGPGLYEWAASGAKRTEFHYGEGTLQPVSLLPGSQTVVSAKEAGLGSGGNRVRQDVRHAISEDGKFVFWTLSASNSTQLYVRDTKLDETVELSSPEAGGEAVFQLANASGTKVFFSDNAQLTPESHATSTRPDLYVAELQEAGGHLTSKITDLTPEAGADFLQPADGDGVIGASESEEDGSNVYFLANGALAPGSTRGHCSDDAEPRPAGTTCNLYVRHYNQVSGEWEPAKLIAAVSQEDIPSFGVGSPNLLYMTARVSPNGGYLAFMSSRRLTGYDNVDEDESSGQHSDEEVYVYDAQTNHLACASCNPDGARPTGIFDTQVADGEGITPVVDRQQSWTERGADHWLSGSVPGWDPISSSSSPYQSRYLSNSGRLFFNSADPLLPLGSVPGEVRTKIERTSGGEELEVGIENVYEYEPGETGGCHSEGGCVGLISSGNSEHESAFLDASESGNDAFFLTAAQLAPQDRDSNFDVYDAHVCEAESPCPPAPEAAPEKCEGESCQGPTSPVPNLLSPASSPFVGENLSPAKLGVLGEKKAAAPTKKPLTRTQKLKKALKLCRKDKSKSKRVACEKKAKKKYGPIKKKSPSKGKG
jgi:DNA-binding beta-propeller fold protein YncE